MVPNPNDTNTFDDCFFDISHNNGNVLNFSELAKTRKGVMYKVSEGTSFRDPSFATYLAQAVAAGIKYHAVYHFAHHGSTFDQMDFFIDTWLAHTKGFSPLPKFLFMLDLERSANPPNEQDGLSMAQYLMGHYEIAPMIYCGFDFWSQAYGSLKPCPCFLAEYGHHPVSPLPWRIPSATVYGFDIWQYTGDGLGTYAKDIPGGSHGMDLSCFNLAKNTSGLDKTWNQWLLQTKQPT